jgi:hypothetical protein
MRPQTADLEHGVFKLATNDPTKPELNTTFANMYRIQACVAPINLPSMQHIYCLP